MTHTLSTILCWQEAGEDHDACADVVYKVHKGYRETMEQPGEPDAVEIISVTRTDSLGDLSRFLEDEELLEECYQDYREDLEAAADARADARRDEMMEKW